MTGADDKAGVLGCCQLIAVYYKVFLTVYSFINLARHADPAR
jgi:hypothetical protein